MKFIKKGITLATLALTASVLLAPFQSAFASSSSSNSTQTSSSTTSSTVNPSHSAGTANSMGRHLVSFLQSSNSSLSVKGLPNYDYSVYGAFISNFFIPWHTEFGALDYTAGGTSTGSSSGGSAKTSSSTGTASNSQAVTLADQLSTKFFGSTGKASTFGQLDKVLYDSMSSDMSSPGGSFTLYANSSHTTILSGTGLFDKLDGKDTDPNIYSSSGKVLMNVDSPATRASMKVIFGLEPNYMLSSSKGLRALHTLYMDGLGNIWGSYQASSGGKGELVGENQFVLFMPAALNPAVFDPKASSPAQFKFPVSNVFALGAVPKINSSNTLNLAPTSPYVTRVPYYNIKDSKYLPQASLNSATSILGIQSPFSYLGNSNPLLTDSTSASNPESLLKSFMNEGATGNPSSQFNIIVSVDPSSSSMNTGLFRTAIKGTSEKEAYWSYFMDSNVLKLNQLADDMYYFQTNGSTPNSGSGYQPSGSFKDVSETGGGSSSASILQQTLFAAKPKSGQYALYSGAYSTSPFLVFLRNYLGKSSSSEKTKYLNSLGINGSPSEMKILENFLNTGSWGTSNFLDISNAMSLLTGSSSIFRGVLESPDLRVKTTGTGLFGDIGNFLHLTARMDSVFALSTSDSTLTSWDQNSSFFKSGNNNTLYGKMINNYPTLTSSEEKNLATEFYNFMAYRVFSMDSTFLGNLTTGSVTSPSYTSPVGGKFTLSSPIDSGVNDYPGIYWGYMVQMLGIKPNSKGGWTQPSTYQNNYLPSVTFATLGGGTLALGSSGSGSAGQSTLPSNAQMEKTILQDTYSLLSPDSHNTYRDQLVKATQDSWIVSTHEALIGESTTNNVNVSAGNSSYASIVGYINTPSLASLPLTRWLLTNYVYIYMLMLLFSLMLMILMVMTNVRSIRSGFLTVLSMSFILILPQFLVGNVITISNLVGNKIFSNKFNYWAIVQQQEELNSAQSAQNSGNNIDAIIQSSMQAQSNVSSTNNGVILKWMAPKTTSNFDQMFGNTSSQGGLQNFTLFRWLFSSYLTQTQYDYSNPLADYAYMPYNTISTEANTSYQAMNGLSASKATILQNIYNLASNAAWVPNYRFALFNPKGVSLNNPNAPVYTPQQKSWISSTGAFGTAPNVYRYWPMMDTAVNKAIFSTSYTGDTGVGVIPTSYSPQYDAFTYATESPFYYFYNVFETKYNSGGQSFKSVLLNKSLYEANSSNPAVSGHLRDFLDMKGLFTYVIPYLEQANSYVYGYTNIHGTSVSGFDFKNSSSANAQLQQQYAQEKQQKTNMQGVWDLYSPWVDQLYSLKVNNQPIGVGGKRVSVQNSLNPEAYRLSGRDMIFSPAGMYAKGYNYSDLSDVERRIQQVERDTEKDMMYLTNYYDFDTQVLVTAAAMDATFNFDRVFSQTSLIGSSSEIYPQNFELKDFNYDAFMRLVLLNATGESVMQNKNLYAAVIANTSIVSGLILLVNDIFGVYVVPAMKIITLLLLFFLSFAISISCVLTPPEKLFKTLIKHLFLPAVYFILATGVFAFVISMFMGDGLSAYVGSSTPSFGFTDPTLTMILMIIVDGAYIFVLWKIVRMLFRSLKSHSNSSLFGTLGLLAGAGSSVLGSIKNGVTGAIGYDIRRGRRIQLLDTIAGGNKRINKTLKKMAKNSESNSSEDYDDTTSTSSIAGADGFVGGRSRDDEPIDNDFMNEVNDLSSSLDDADTAVRYTGRDSSGKGSRGRRSRQDGEKRRRDILGNSDNKDNQ